MILGCESYSPKLLEMVCFVSCLLLVGCGFCWLFLAEYSQVIHIV